MIRNLPVLRFTYRSAKCAFRKAGFQPSRQLLIRGEKDMKSGTNRTFLWVKAAARPTSRTLALVACVLAVTLYATAQANTCHSVPIVINIDYPQSVQTQPVAISNTGAITGNYESRDQKTHGFLRSPDGSFTSFDRPGAVDTLGWSINATGQIAGTYSDSSNVYHGFFRDADGTITSFDAPDAGTGPFQGTVAYNINPTGEIAGQASDNNGVSHAFVRHADGSFIAPIDVPGAGTGSDQGTYSATVDGLNPRGMLVGNTIDSSGANHGYVLNADGSLLCSPFDVPGDGNGSGQGTVASGINQTGIIEGAWADSNYVSHGFVGRACGPLRSFDVPGAGTGQSQGTGGGSINALGEITANWIDSNNVSHGFVREPNGMILKFDAPGAGTG
jgi:hypothetical protein